MSNQLMLRSDLRK